MSKKEEKITKRFADILNLLDEDDTITINKEDLRAAIVELREETMVKTATLTRHRCAEVVDKRLRSLSRTRVRERNSTYHIVIGHLRAIAKAIEAQPH